MLIITEDGMTKPILESNGRRRMLVMCAAMCAAACSMNVTHGKKRTMQSARKDLWQIITSLEEHMPLTLKRIETILGLSFAETKRRGPFVIMAAEGLPLADGLTVSPSLMVPATREFNDKSSFGMELEGACISLDEVRRRYGELQLTQHPRGRSLQETAVWSAKRPWGTLSFAFREDKPDCLFDVSFQPH